MFRDHVQKFSQKSQNLIKISGLQKFFKYEILHHLGKQKIDITRLFLKKQEQILHASLIFIVEKIIFWHQGQKTTF